MSVKKLNDERRQALRAKRILSIQYRLARSKYKGGETRWHISTTQDMSILGISFLSEISFHLDDILEMQVIMSGIIDIYKGYGQVVRLEKKEQGAYYLVAVKLLYKLPRAQRNSITQKKTPKKATSLRK